MSGPATATASSNEIVNAGSRWKFLAWISTWLLVVYLLIVLPVNKVLPAFDRWFVTPLVLLAFGIAVRWAVTRLVVSAGQPKDRAINITFLSFTLLFCTLAIDIGFTAYTNYNSAFRVDQKRILESRFSDGEVWTQELLPVKFQPTNDNFEIYKPSQTKRARVYGEHYYPQLLSFPVLRDSVLSAIDIEFDTDTYGLRNNADAAAAGVFMLGDSFCLGYHVTQDATVTARLSSRIAEPVYNLGVENSSPMQEVLLLQHMLKTYPDALKPKRVLWLLFEGNDLEDDYRVTNPPNADNRSLGKIFGGTLIADIVDIPTRLRSESVLRMLTSGQLSLNGALSRNTHQNHFALDGKTLAYPLYHSAQFGYRLFRQVYLERATKPASYVQNHPNRPKLVDAFQRMQKLAQEHGFQVTVVVAPTAVRLYRDAFEDFPAVTPVPYFINYLSELSTQFKFDHLDLNEGLAPYAKKEMLYHRDDTHWNERGNDQSAEIIAHYLTQLQK